MFQEHHKNLEHIFFIMCSNPLAHYHGLLFQIKGLAILYVSHSQCVAFISVALELPGNVLAT